MKGGDNMIKNKDYNEARKESIVRYIQSFLDENELDLANKIADYLDNIRLMNIKQFKIFENTMELSEQTALSIVDEYSEFGLGLDKNLRMLINKNKGLV